MSHENIEVFRRGLDAFNRADLDAWLETIDPDVRFAPIRARIEGVYRGHEGARRFFRETQESYDSFALDYPDIRELGDDRLLVIGTVHLRASASGIETDLPTAAVATIRDGLLIDWNDYGDPEKAIEAARLRE